VAGLSLDEAAERLYDAFADVPRPRRVAGCSHCVSPAEELSLVSRPLRELSEVDLSRYAFKAMSTWGTGADFRWAPLWTPSWRAPFRPTTKRSLTSSRRPTTH
jgi:hypothetical protein